MSLLALPLGGIEVSFSLVLAELTACVCEHLAELGAGPTCWCGLWPGEEVSWEYCDNCGAGTCGMGYVRIVQVFPYSTFPFPESGANCVSPLAAELEVGALRCVPIPADGEIASPAELTEATFAQVNDMWAMRRAIECCPGFEGASLGLYTPSGPAGACVGGHWQAFLPLEV